MAMMKILGQWLALFPVAASHKLDCSFMQVVSFGPTKALIRLFVFFLCSLLPLLHVRAPT